MEPQDILKLTPFFGAVLDQSELDLLAENLRVASFPRGSVLLRQGDAGSSMFVVVDGKARVTVHSIAPAARPRWRRLAPAIFSARCR